MMETIKEMIGDGKMDHALGANYPTTEITHRDDCEGHNCLPNHATVNSQGLLHNDYDYRKHSSACQYDGRYIVSTKKVSWSDAKDLCEGIGLQLARITAYDVPQFKATVKFFLNLPHPNTHPFDENTWFWIGGTDKKEEGKWGWAYKNTLTRISDEILNKLPWRKIKNSKKTQPDNAQRLPKSSKTQNVMAVSLFGEFDDSYDDPVRTRGFVCQCPALVPFK